MKPLISLLTFLALITSSVGAEPATSVAKVDYRKIDDLLETVVLSNPEHKELREAHLAAEKKSADAQKKMQEAIMKGEKINPMEAGMQMMNQGHDKRVSQLCQKYLLALIEETFKGKYKIILKDEYRSSILYTEVAIEDITDIIHQELLKKSPKWNGITSRRTQPATRWVVDFMIALTSNPFVEDRPW